MNDPLAARPARRPRWLRGDVIASLLSSYAYFGVAGLITLFAIPVYVRLLGEEHWGVVAVCLTVQGFLMSLDALLGPVMLRDVALAGAQGSLRQTYRRFLVLHVGVAAALFLIGQALVGMWASGSLEAALRLGIGQFLFQFPNGAATGFWHARRHGGLAYGRLVCFLLAKHGLALAALSVMSPDPLVFLAPFVVVSAVEFALNQRLVAATIAGEEPARGDPAGGPVSQWQGIAGFGIGALVGLVSGQIDRLVLSATLSGQEYGVYFLLGTVALSLMHLQLPVQRAYLPRIATAARPRDEALAMLRTIFLLVALPSLMLAAIPETLLVLWLRNPVIAAQGAETLRMLLVAVALSALFAPASALLLQARRHSALLAIQLLGFVAQCGILVAFTAGAGMAAGAWSWLAGGAIRALFAVVVFRSLGPAGR